MSDKEVFISKLRKIADLLESGYAELLKVEGMISGDASYDEFKVGVKYHDRIENEN